MSEQHDKSFDKFLSQLIKVNKCNQSLNAVLWTAGRFPNKYEENDDSKNIMYNHIMQTFDKCIEEATKE